MKARTVLMYHAIVAGDAVGADPHYSVSPGRFERQLAPLTNKQGHRILPALRPQTWDVGLRFGAAFQAYQRQKSRNDTQGTGGQKRPHIRRAHWHGFWYGAKTDAAKREFRLCWVAPTMVGGHLDNLPATVHKVTAP